MSAWISIYLTIILYFINNVTLHVGYLILNHYLKCILPLFTRDPCRIIIVLWYRNLLPRLSPSACYFLKKSQLLDLSRQILSLLFEFLRYQYTKSVHKISLTKLAVLIQCIEMKGRNRTIFFNSTNGRHMLSVSMSKAFMPSASFFFFIRCISLFLLC